MIVATIGKQNWEEFLAYIDFANDLGVGDTIATVVSVTSRIEQTGVDSSATLLQAASAIIVGTYVYKGVKAGTAPEWHLLEIRITTAAGNKIEHELRIIISAT